MDWSSWFDEVQAPLGAVLVEERRDEIGPVQVIERGGQRLLYFNTPNCQGRGWDQALEQPASEYHPSILLSAALPTKLRKALVLGLGAGALPAGLLASFPDAEVHAVELRKIVADISYEIYGLPQSPQLHVHVEDAAEYLERWEGEVFDLVMIDLALGEGVSPLLLKEEFWQLCRGALAVGGVLSANLWQGEQHSYSMIAGLMRGQAPHGLCWLEHRSIGNIVLSTLPEDFAPDAFLRRAVSLGRGIRRDLLPIARHVCKQVQQDHHFKETPEERRISRSNTSPPESPSETRRPAMVWRSQPTRVGNATPTPAPQSNTWVTRKWPSSALLSLRAGPRGGTAAPPGVPPETAATESAAATESSTLFPLVTPTTPDTKRSVSDDAISALMAAVLDDE